MASVLAVCTSEKKGTTKTAVPEIVVEKDYGVKGDAHADCATHRQVSLLANESINKMRNKGYELKFGDFAENITTEGIDLPTLTIGTRFNIGKDVILELTQIGKECHADCAIRQQIGDCVMPREGVFTRVIKGGRVKAGDEIKIT
ncbi:MAG: MOSC domain-containing protein [Dehalococcoidales bacterium]|jgi:MOSC domain-containing protein YiiM